MASNDGSGGKKLDASAKPFVPMAPPPPPPRFQSYVRDFQTVQDRNTPPDQFGRRARSQSIGFLDLQTGERVNRSHFHINPDQTINAGSGPRANTFTPHRPEDVVRYGPYF